MWNTPEGWRKGSDLKGIQAVRGMLPLQSPTFSSWSQPPLESAEGIDWISLVLFLPHGVILLLYGVERWQKQCFPIAALVPALPALDPACFWRPCLGAALQIAFNSISS